MTQFQAICIGDELLDGRVRDTNAAALGALLADRGHSLAQVVVVPDDLEAIVRALGAATGDVVVVSGGLGPTVDDITRDAAASWLGVPLVQDEGDLARLRQRFADRGRDLSPNNLKQAMFPGSADVLTTDVGTASGFAATHEGRRTLFFPGVPSEFEWFAERHVAPLAQPGPRVVRRFAIHGLPESEVETRLIAAGAHREGLGVGYRADYPIIEVKLSGDSESVLAANRAAQEALAPWVVSTDGEDMAARLGRLLSTAGATVTTAESCTAGGIAARITDIAGSSSWFERGFVTYSNDAKAQLLGVSPDIVERYGAVSAQTVCQMASGARRAADSTYAVAVSGIAGPGGGTADKPVGTVHFGLATPDGVYHRLVHYSKASRDRVRAGTAATALALLIWHLEGVLDAHPVTFFAENAVWSVDGVGGSR